MKSVWNSNVGVPNKVLLEQLGHTLFIHTLGGLMHKGRLRHRPHDPWSLRHLLFGPFGRTCPDVWSRGRDQPLGVQFPPAQALIIAHTQMTHAEVRGHSAVLLFHCCLESVCCFFLILFWPSLCLQKLADFPLIYHSSVPLEWCLLSLRGYSQFNPQWGNVVTAVKRIAFPILLHIFKMTFKQKALPQWCYINCFTLIFVCLKVY